MTHAEVERLYREHGHMVLRRARRILGDDEEARDIVQELFTHMVRGARFDGRSQVTTFLYAVTTNLCITRLRKRRTQARLLALRPQVGAADGPAEARLALTELLAKLPQELVAVAVYYHGDDMTMEEIAEVLGCSRQKVSQLLARLHERVDARWRAA